MSSKAQLQINETILVIIIFTIIAIGALVFFHRFTVSGIESMVLDNQRLSFYDMLSQVPKMPELKCTTQNVDDDCIDIYKVMSLKKQQLNYISRFGFKTLKLKLIHPDFPNRECTEELFQTIGFPNCDEIIVYDRKLQSNEATEIISTPVAVYDPVNDQYLLANLEITWYY